MEKAVRHWMLTAWEMDGRTVPGPAGPLALPPYARLGKTRCTSAASVHPVKRILLCVPCLGRMEARVSRSRRLRLPWELRDRH